MTPEEEEYRKYRKQQRQEAEEQMAQMAAREAQEQADARISKGASQQLDNATPPMRKAVTDINFQVPGANNYGLKTEHNDDLGIDEVKSDSKGFATPEDPDVGNKYLKKMLREQYANDNEGYKEALARDGLDNDETNGVQSIMQAYYSGKIDKNTRDYMMADAIAKFARNTGRDIGNIGAQFTGGSINNNYETSEWDKRNSALAGNETTARLAEQEGSEANLKRQSDNLDIEAKKLTNELTNMKLEVPRVWKGLVDNADSINDPILKVAVKGAAQTMLDKTVNGGEVTVPAMIAAIVANGGNELAEAAQKAGKSVEAYVADGIKDFFSFMGPTVNINAGTNIASMFGNKNSSDTGPLERPEENGDKNPQKGSDAAHSNSASKFSDSNKNKLYTEIANGRKNSGVAQQIMSQTDANTDDSFTSLPPEKQQAWLDIFEHPIANKWFNKDNDNIVSAMSLMEKDGPDAVKKLIKDESYAALSRENARLQVEINKWAGYTDKGSTIKRNTLLDEQTKVQRQMKELNEW